MQTLSRHHRKLSLERLETRITPSVTLSDGGTLALVGTAGDDSFHVIRMMEHGGE